MKIEEGLFYTKEHEWIKIEGASAKAGITDYAQHKLGDITYIEPQDAGKEVKKGEALTGIESVKAASDMYSPVNAKIKGFNTALETAPEAVNNDPYGAGWIFELELEGSADTSDLMDAEAYKKYTEGLE
ncbi:MAG TPA: glycine cleavage system protein GcvH [bacterium]|nr:glycine cleavage system protein GcvH [bacterium]